MVHALKQVHSLLKPDGILIDIHPLGEPPPIEVRLGTDIYTVGWVREADDYAEYAAADEALETAVSRKLYTWQKQGSFTFTTYADDILHLRSHLAETWSDAIIDDDVIGRAQDLMRTPDGDKEVILREVIKIARLKPVNSGQCPPDQPHSSLITHPSKFLAESQTPCSETAVLPENAVGPASVLV